MKMTNFKRILAGASATTLLFSSCINCGITAIAETTDSDESTFSVNVPDSWTNTAANWIEASDDLKIYFKTSDRLRNSADWGAYTDSDAREWTGSVEINETDSDGDYIKFWAVKDDTVQNNPDAVRYYFDKTAPNGFSLAKDGGENSTPYILHSNDTIIDSLSGINAVYYSIGQEYGSVEEIKSNAATVDFTTDRDNIIFSIICSPEMNGNSVFVYVIDNAGNIQTSTITVDSYMDTSAPSLIIEGIDGNGWVNKESRQSNWNIRTDSDGAKIYYAISDEDLGDEWGSYEDATDWSEDAVIPEGEKYIHFWAAYDSSERDVAEETHFYKYDDTPAILELNNPETKQINPWWSVLNLSSNSISDNLSGVKTIRLKLNGGYNQELHSGDVKRDDNGCITSFSIDLNQDINNSDIIFVVTDYADNSKEYSLNGVSFFQQSPKIDELSVKIISQNNEERPIHTFGSSNQNNKNVSTYSNDNSYFYLEIEDDDLRAITMTIGNSTFELNEDEIKKGNGEWKKEGNKYYIKIKLDTIKSYLAKNNKNYISVSALDHDPSHKSNIVDLQTKDEERYSLFYDPNDNEDSVIISNTSIAPTTLNDNNYYGSDYEKNTISFDIEDDNGIKEYSVKINGNVVTSADLSRGTETTGTYTTVVTNDDGEPVTNEDGETVTTVVNESYYMPFDKTTYTIPLENDKYELYDFSKDGKYEIVVSAEDLAGNFNDNNYTFIIDTTAPIITNCEYKYNKSLIKYLSFGLFGNESYDISVNVTDITGDENVPGIGIESVKLFWDSDTDPYEGHYNSETGMYEFSSLRVGHNEIPTIIVTDKLGNTARYCMASADDTDDNNDHRVNIQLEKLQFDDSEGKIPLVLENTLPISSVKPIESFETPENDYDELKIYKQIFEDGHEEWWYPNNFEYQVIAHDEGSGLYSVVITENDVQRAEESECNDVPFSTKSFVDQASFSYGIKDEGDYKLFTYAIDNAQNTNQSNPLSEQSFIVHLDKTKPQITEFQFGGNPDQGETVERTTYGFFFTEDTEARVYVDDSKVSSGLNTVVLYLNNVNGENRTITQAASSFKTEDGRKYASFTIEKGFKGKVTSIVTDNVGHSSGIINANGNIVEDPDLHSRTSFIEIKANESAKQNDANDVPLYNTSIPVTVTVEDSFSGIKTIDWNIVNDNEEGKIEVGLDGNWNNVKGEAQIIEDSIVRDQNLITKLQFVIVVDSNTNGNVVRVVLTDRSGNTSEYEATYSIDTTSPTISASLGDGKVQNGNYYNSDRTVTVSIIERNFDPGAVVVKMNDNVQNVEWNEEELSVTSDETVHTGTFAITADGEYDFTVSYTDMAGNVGTPYLQSRFIIDKTRPKITNNFESFGSIDDENIYFNLSQREKVKAEITVEETNFYPEDMKIIVYCQPEGSAHTGFDENWPIYSYNPDWKDSGDNLHILNIPFTKNGVYKIVMDPVDRAGNDGDFSKGENSQYPNTTAIFEADYTVPVIASRDNNSVSSDDTKFYDLYDFERRNDAAPTVVFEDTNIDRIVCEGHKYTPVYTNGREIGEIKPEDISGESNKLIPDSDVPQMMYTLDGFTTDGVYSVKLIAYDKAGNKSVLNDNTYVRMIDPTVNVLAYIENSNRKNLEGWYSFEDESGPISKQPGSFSDLSIVVLSKNADTRICLVDKATNTSMDTNITDTKNAIFDDGMYQVGAYRYTLPGEYFEKNYTADADTNLYLRVVNNGESLDLGEMYIDNTNPDCTIPEHFHDWGWFSGSGNQSIKFENISETLDINETLAYVDGQTIHLSNIKGNETSIFSYDEKNSALTLTLEPGSHKVGLLLIDRAGNSKSISEVQHLAIGNYRIWIGVGAGLGAILLAGIVVFVVKRFKRKRLN